MSKLSLIETYQLRLRCAEVALLAAIKLDFTRADGLAFAEKIWEFMEKPLKENNEALPSKNI